MAHPMNYKYKVGPSFLTREKKNCDTNPGWKKIQRTTPGFLWQSTTFTQKRNNDVILFFLLFFSSDLKFPKLKFKGVKQATVIRAKSKQVFVLSSFIHLFSHLFIHSFIQSSIYSFVRLFIHSFLFLVILYIFNQLFIHPSIHSVI